MVVGKKHDDIVIRLFNKKSHVANEIIWHFINNLKRSNTMMLNVTEASNVTTTVQSLKRSAVEYSIFYAIFAIGWLISAATITFYIKVRIIEAVGP